MNTITKLFVLLSICFYSQSHAQNSRLFYQTKQEDVNQAYNFCVSEKDGVPYFFSIKENDGTFMKLTYGPLDEETLSPLSYNYITLPVEKSRFKFLNGINIVGDRLDIVVQSKIGTSFTSKFEFIEVDLANESILNVYSTQETYHAGFFRARSANEKLILYATNSSTQELIRFEKDLTNNYTTDTVSGTFGVFTPALRSSELEIFNGTEYLGVITSSIAISFVKRLSNASYTTHSINVGTSVRKWDFIPFQTNNFLFIGATKAIILDEDLSVTSDTDINFMDYIGGFPSTNAVVRNNELYIFSEGSSSLGSLYKTDLQFNIIEHYLFDRQIVPFDVVQRGNDVWMIGKSRDEVGSLNQTTTPSSLIINRNCNKSPIEEYHRLLSMKDFKFNVGNYNRLFQHTPNATSSFAYTASPNHPCTIFESSDNILGKNENDELVGIWSRYGLNNPLFPGPLFTSVADSNLQRDKYNRSYYVTSQMISDHVGHILTYGNPNYGMPNGIRYWPANGNTANGESAKIAEFIDINGNEIYEPHLGEFPKIYGDECLLTVYHQPDIDSLGNNLEVHRYLFSYNCDTNEVLKNTLFCNVKYINRGNDLHDVYVGSFIDYDMGYSGDDFVGTHVGLGMIYGYNGDSFDETNGGQIGFQDSIPALGQLLLLGSKQENNGVDDVIGVQLGESINGVGFGDGIIDNEYYTLESSYYMTNSGVFPHTDGLNTAQFYYNLQGLASDGTPQVVGAVGPYTLTGQSDPDFYATGGIPHANDFSEVSAGNASGDRRMLSGSGSGVLAAGDTLNYLSAYILSFGSQNDPNGPSVGQLFVDAQKVKDYFTNNDLGCGKSFDISDASLSVKPVKTLDFLMYPNPFNQTLNIQHDFIGNVDLSIRNLNGQEVLNQTNIASVHTLSLDLNAGIYFVELSSSKGKVIKKLVRK